MTETLVLVADFLVTWGPRWFALALSAYVISMLLMLRNAGRES